MDFSFYHPFLLAVTLTHSLIQWTAECCTKGTRMPERESQHSTPTNLILILRIRGATLSEPPTPLRLHELLLHVSLPIQTALDILKNR
jgi:hypothetical protein